MVLGYRSKTRQKFKRPFRSHGAINMATYLTHIKIGDYVTVMANSAIHKGMPHHFYHGRTGQVFNVNPRAIGVRLFKKVNGRYIEKRIHVRREHVVISNCRTAFVARIQKNDQLKHEAKKNGQRISTKRQIAKPRPARESVSLALDNVTFRVNKPFIELH